MAVPPDVGTPFHALAVRLQLSRTSEPAFSGVAVGVAFQGAEMRYLIANTLDGQLRWVSESEVEMATAKT
jgi:hypothetical protein